ncbi:restriction endonuclease subunit S, partial [uncultured Parvimonas sp.]|uniref:restriction endonuclease subunit S n=1 Tax=uncultured Parvimonas sp. TaxID=747372 RepID=UPI0025960304
MSLEWESKSFSDLVDIIGGGTPKTSIDEYWNGDIPWISIKDFNSGQKYVLSTEKTITELGLNNSSTKLLHKDDIIISARGTVGEVAMIKYEMAFNQSCYGLKVHELLDKDFVYYLLRYNINKLRNMVHGAVFDTITTNTFDNIIVNVPPQEYQEKISYLLSNIDNLIEVKIHENKNLEKMLITIFNSWFINFENYDNSKGMKIDDSYGEIPVDWSVEMLEDYVDFVTGVEPGSKNYHEKPEPNDIPFLRVGDLGSRDNGVFIDPSLSKNKILKYDDIVLSLDATIGIVKMGLEGAYSTGMRKLVIKNDNINQPFLYCLVKSNRIQRIIETFATGTTILHAGKSIKHMNFVLSDKKTMDDFGKIGNPIISIILTNLKEIEYLTNLRDTLLPKLMSGEIDVS